MSIKAEFSNITDEERLLLVVDPRVTEILGSNTTLEIEKTYSEIDRLDHLAKQPNPFNMLLQEVDFSFLAPKLLEKIEERLEEAASFTWSAGRLPKQSEVKTSVKLAVGLQLLGSKASNACLDLIKSGEKRLASYQIGVDNLTSAYIRKPDELDIVELQKLMELLGVEATRLPTPGTLDATKGIFKSAEAMGKTIESVRKQLLVRSRIGDSAFEKTSRRIKEQLVRIDEITDYRTEVAKEGRSNFASLQDVAKKEEEHKALALLSDLDQIRISLIQSAVDSLQPDVLTAEQYLITKASAVELYLRGISAPALGRSEIRHLIGRLLTSDFAKIERSRQVLIEQEKSSGLNAAVSEARDVLKGGRRLEVKNGERIQQLADDLHALSREDQRSSLTAEKNGIIVAIIAAKFDRFCQTLAHVKSDADEALLIVERNRPEVIKELRNFNLATAVDQIRFVLEQNPDDFQEILSNEELVNLRLAIEKYYSASDNVVSEEAFHTSATIEKVLPPEELINQLDWTVLPKGEKGLEDATYEIVKLAQTRAARGIQIEIDLERLNILKNVRAAWNEMHPETSHHFYARGKLKGRGKVTTAKGESSPDEYIVLVLQKKDESGRVILEHAIAESPIAGVNAVYLLRSDVAAGSWEEIFSLSKKEARTFGARDVRHTKGDGRPVVDVLTERINLLLNCSPEQFFAIRFDGARLWVRRQLGQVATR